MENLLIEYSREADLDFILALESHQENSPFIFPNTREEHLQLIHNKDIEHLIIKNEDDESIGFAIIGGLENKHGSIELRRIVIKDKGKGYGKAAMLLLMNRYLVVKKCHRLWLDVLEENNRARHVYKKIGFKEEGVLRECIFMAGEYKSLVVMSVLQNERI